MAKRKKYPEEFKKDAVRLFMARGDRTAQEVADGLGVRANKLYTWQKKYGPELAESEPSQNAENIEVLRRRNRQLEMENAILKKAAAFFAKEIL